MAGIYMAIKAELRLGPTSYMNDRLGGSSNVAAMIPTRRPPRPLSQCTTGHLPSIRVHMFTDRGIRVHADSPTLLYRLIEPPTPTYFALRLPLSWYSAPPTKLKKSHTIDDCEGCGADEGAESEACIVDEATNNAGRNDCPER
eukprot:scaffold696_cov417-Prasinococcus_capsulatus_cf.AAC.3